MNSQEILNEFGFIIEDRQFMNNYGHLLEKEWLGKWFEVFGQPNEVEDQAVYYEKLAFGLAGKQITEFVQGSKTEE